MNRYFPLRSNFERIALFLILLLASGMGLATNAGQNASGSATGGAVPFVRLLLFLYFFLWAVTRAKRSFTLVLRECWIGFLGLWIFASILWSVEAGQTARYSLAFTGTVLVGFYLGVRFEPREQVKLVASCLGITAILSVILALTSPSLAISPEGEWRGVFLHKNPLGYTMSLGALCFLFLAFGQRRKRWVFVCMMMICLTLIVLSRSAGAIATTVFMFAIIQPTRKILTLSHRKFILVVTTGSFVIIASTAWVFQHPGPFLDMLGKDATLTGRVQLWHYVKQEVMSRPALGFGYSAFWSTGEADRIRAAVGWDPPNSHNGFLDATLGLGFIGLLILLAGLARNLLFGIRLARYEDDLFQSWPLFFMIFAVLGNITDTWITGSNACCKPPFQLGASSLLLILYVANSYWLVRVSRETESHRSSQFCLNEDSSTILGLEPTQS